MNDRWVTLLSLSLFVLLLGCTSAATMPSGNAPSGDASSENTENVSPAVASNRGQSLPITAQAQVRGATLSLEVARTPQQQAMGLMYRPALPDDRGMLFAFNSPRLAQFWMKNVPVPLDMVFLLDDEVKAIAASVPPCTADPCPTYGPRTAVNQVIELRGGRAAELGIQVGDRVIIEPVNP